MRKEQNLVIEITSEDTVFAVASQGETLLDFFINAKVEISHSCGGMGTCGTCRVEVKSPELLPEPNDIEIEMIRDRCFKVGERLSCQIQPLPNMKVVLPR
jgi:2Fe-2S ferredoxin